MQLSVKGKQVDVGDALRQHIESQLKEITGKYFSQSLEAQVTVSREAHLFRADITVHAGHNMVLQANASANEPYPAFDAAATRIAGRLRRYKNKIKHHHQENGRQQQQALMANAFVLNGEEHDREEQANDNPVVVAEMTTPIETLSVGEAVMRLDLGDLPALLFRTSQGTFNMIYRRPDGHVGWVDPSHNMASHLETTAMKPKSAKA